MSGARRAYRSTAVALLGAAAVLMASCSSGESILDAGRSASATLPPPPDDTTAGTATIPSTTVPPLSNYPSCPADALDEHTGKPVDITFWHGMGSGNGEALAALTKEFNESQDQVRVRLEYQGGYSQTIDKYRLSSQSSRPDMVMLPEYMLQEMVDSESVIPAAACVEASGFDVKPFASRTLDAYSTQGIHWAMPFNMSTPILYYNKKAFLDAGLDPEKPPLSVEQLERYSKRLVDSGAAGAGIGFESGSDSGGGWFMEQWIAKAGAFFADNNNGRSAPATRVLYNTDTAVELFETVQSMVNDRTATYIGDNAETGFDQLLAMADKESPTAMAIASSAALGIVKSMVDGGTIEGMTLDDLGVGPMPGPTKFKGALLGGASLYVMSDKDDAVTAGAWKYTEFLTSAKTQSTWAAATGYVPVREDSTRLDPLKSVYRDDPRFKVAYDQLAVPADDPTANGPVLGPMAEIRDINAQATASIYRGADVRTTLDDAANQANARIREYAESH